ncbi:hypothetical protein I5682_14830 [Citrobacter werkmanii]|nr:hypothetical protein [Citrobacter werkmanii]MBJ9873755.1 hypothetical protein [Citrobacter werkmanii]
MSVGEDQRYLLGGFIFRVLKWQRHHSFSGQYIIFNRCMNAIRTPEPDIDRWRCEGVHVVEQGNQ